MGYFKSSKKHSLSIAVVDDLFPHPICIDNWRGIELQAYLEHFPKLHIYTTLQSRMLVDALSVDAIMKQYSSSAPREWVKRTNYFDSSKKELTRNPDAFYFIFLNNAYSSLDIINRYEKPFLFTLYPGGGFALDNEESDKKLWAVVSNNNFRGVLATSNVTYRYLIDKCFCNESQVFSLLGIVMSDEKLDSEHYAKIRYGYGKETFDICFVANRYSEKGEDKGYDIFIEVAKRLAGQSCAFKFHVVGRFDESILDVSELGDSITFYGVRNASFFDSFYHDKDLFISPNRPSVLVSGSFDGFPTGCAVDAIVRKTAAFCTDLTANPQNMSQYIPGQEIEIISLDCTEVLERVMYYFSHPNELAQLADNGARKARELYSEKNQLLPRIQWLKTVMNQELIKTTVP